MPIDTGYRECRYTSQDGLGLYYRDYGDPLAPRTPVLCLPGLTRNSADFDTLAAHLSQKRRVVCPDLRGRGRSDYDPEPGHYVGPTYVNDIHHLLIVTGIHRAVVVGTSMGGLLAMGLGVAIPTAMAAVVLNDVGPEISDETAKRISTDLSTDRPMPSWEAAVAGLREKNPHLSYRTDAEWRRFAEATYREAEDGQLHYDWDTRVADPTLNRHAAASDLWRLFRSLRSVPLLVIRGGLSDVLSAATLERMTKEHPGLCAVTLPQIGHVPALSEPPALDAIDDFIADI
jgi:pimeloyl-ACP methyl ester carboxylesterase